MQEADQAPESRNCGKSTPNHTVIKLLLGDREKESWVWGKHWLHMISRQDFAISSLSGKKKPTKNWR
jgi:hypothetical protein